MIGLGSDKNDYTEFGYVLFLTDINLVGFIDYDSLEGDQIHRCGFLS